MPGYDILDSQLKGASTENVSKYRCPACHLLLRDAVQPSCGHWLCTDCAVEIFATKSRRCPRDDCGEELVPEDGQDVRTRVPYYCTVGLCLDASLYCTLHCAKFTIATKHTLLHLYCIIA
jgi:hypothetical protein